MSEEDDGLIDRLRDSMEGSVMWRAADKIEALEAVLREAREVIVALVDSRWSEVESTGAEEVAFIDAALKQD